MFDVETCMKVSHVINDLIENYINTFTLVLQHPEIAEQELLISNVFLRTVNYVAFSSYIGSCVHN